MANIMHIINLNNASAQFAEKYYNNSEEDIIYDILNFAKNIRESQNLDDYNILKAFKAIMSYCGIKHVDINKFIKLKIE